jgi:hypothetical protein
MGWVVKVSGRFGPPACLLSTWCGGAAVGCQPGDCGRGDGSLSAAVRLRSPYGVQAPVLRTRQVTIARRFASPAFCGPVTYKLGGVLTLRTSLCWLKLV